MDTHYYLSGLSRFGIPADAGDAAYSHFLGVFGLLEEWHCSEQLQLAGLCHNVYDDKTFSTNENRDYLRDLIGNDAEQIIYLFSAADPKLFFTNDPAQPEFEVVDTFDSNSKRMIPRHRAADVVLLALANWLEQRPRLPVQRQVLYQNEFAKMKPLLSEAAYDSFLKAYTSYAT